MKLNRVEFILINNPVRARIQEYYELKILLNMYRNVSVLKSFDTVLEIGCGNGNGTKLIKKYFSPKKIYAIDLDERMISIAKRRNIDPTITFEVMDASKLRFSDNYFDAVFDFGVIHHIPDWRDSIDEIWRVLKKDGLIVLEELSIDSFDKGIGKVWRKLLDHPYESMFSVEEFIEYLKAAGFKILGFRESNPIKLIKFFSLIAGKR
jgi:ubiquinone/menaquinone biosynthesis C-methylase UbiE